MKRQSDRVGTCRGNETYIGFGDITVLELLPERSRFVRPDHLREHVVEQPWRVALAVGHKEHIALGVKPVAEVDTLDIERVAGFGEHILATDM